MCYANIYFCFELKNVFLDIKYGALISFNNGLCITSHQSDTVRRRGPGIVGRLRGPGCGRGPRLGPDGGKGPLLGPGCAKGFRLGPGCERGPLLSPGCEKGRRPGPGGDNGPRLGPDCDVLDLGPPKGGVNGPELGPLDGDDADP